MSRQRALQRGADLERALERVVPEAERTARIGSRRAEADNKAFHVGEWLLQAECKYRRQLPKLLTQAIGQAAAYNRAATPVAVLRERGGRALICLDLATFAAITGISSDLLPMKHSPTRRSARQLDLLDLEARHGD